jgi:hypothetical protein
MENQMDQTHPKETGQPKTPDQNAKSKLPLIMIILLLILLIPLAGYFIITQTSKNKTSVLPTPVATTSTTPTTSPTQSVAPIATSSPSAKLYLEIPEMNVKIPLSDAIKDAYYQMNNGYVYFSVHSLDSEPECAPTKTSLAALERNNKDEIDQRTGEKYSANPNGVTIGNYFYNIGSAQASCSNNDEKLTVANTAIKAFVDSSKLIEKL